MLRLVLMPKIGVNMVDAIVQEWLVGEGDRVDDGQTLFTAETDKAVQDIPSTGSGVIAKLLVQSDDVVACQQPVAVLCDAGDRFGEADIAALLNGGAPESEETMKPIPAAAPIQDAVPKTSGARVRISPLAAKEAKSLGIRPEDIPPAKPGQRIGIDDVKRYVERMNAAKAGRRASESVPLSGARRVIAGRMLESWQSKPAVALNVEADAEGLMAWRTRSKSRNRELRYNEMLIHIVAIALKEFPDMNASLEGENIVRHESVNVGFAVDSRQGLLVPKVFDADKKDIYAIQEEMYARIEHVRASKVTLDELSNGTFTITNLGMFGVEHFNAIINPPECAILAIGAIVEKPVVRNHYISIGHTMQLTLSFDHRIVDGAYAAKFLARVRELMEHPAALFD